MTRWLEQVSKESVDDQATAVIGEHVESGQGSMNAVKTDLDVNKPEDLGVTDVPHEDDGENKVNADPDDQVKIDPDKAPGTKTLSDTSISTESHPNEPVIGGKMPEESKMDEDPRGEVTHKTTTDESVKVTDNEVSMPETDTEESLEADDGIKKINGEARTHEPQQTREARKQLEGDVDVAKVDNANVSIEDAEGNLDNVDLSSPEAPLNVDGTDVEDVVRDEANEAPEGVTGAPDTQLASDIVDITQGNGQDPVQEAAEHMNEVADDLEEMELMSQSLERYHELLTQATANGGLVDPLLAKAVQIGMESFGEPWMVDGMPSLESYSDPTDRFTVSNEAMDNIKGKLADLAKATRNAIAKLWEWLQDLWNRISADADKLKAKADELIQKAGGIEELNEAPMPIKGAERLYISKVFAGDTVQPIVELNRAANSFLVAYPKMTREMLEVFAKTMKKQYSMKIEAEHVIAAAIQAYADHFKPDLLKMYPVKGDAVPGKLQKYDAVVATKPLQGNMAFYAAFKHKDEINGQKFGAETSGAYHGNDVFKVDFARIPGSEVANYDDQVRAPDQAEIVRMLKAVQSLCDLMDDLDVERSELKAVRETIESKIIMSSYMGSDFMDVSTARMMAQKLASNAITPVGAFSGYLYSVVKAYLAVIERYIRHHNPKAVEAEEGAFRHSPRALPAA